MDIDSDGNSYRTKPTVFNSNTDSNADYNANNGINYNTNSITRSNNTCKAPTQV